MAKQHSPRPRADGKSPIGVQRYALLKAAFAHVQKAICDGNYLEAITVLESILTDRLGSLVHGSLGREVTLRHTLGGLIALAKQGPESGKAPLPGDVVEFICGALSDWWELRNRAVHGMAKLHHVGDAPFADRYTEMSGVALNGVRALIRLDELDQREKARNRAGHSATWPDAVRPNAQLEQLLSSSSVPAS